MWWLAACTPSAPRGEDIAPDLHCDVPGTICTWLGVAGVAYFSPDGDHRTETEAYLPLDISFAPDGTAFYADFNNQRIRQVALDGIVTTIAGGGMVGDGHADGGDCWEPCPAEATLWHNPTDAVPDPSDPDTVWVASWANDRIVRVSLVDETTTFWAGDAASYSHEDGPRTLASFYRPSSIAAGEEGELYVADQANHVVRHIDADGTVTTIAGTPRRIGYDGDGGKSDIAHLHGATEDERDPGSRIALDGRRLLLTDSNNGVIRSIDLDTGIIDTIAGRNVPMGTTEWLDVSTGEVYEADIGSLPGYNGDGGPALDAIFAEPHDIALGPDGELYIADTGNHCVRVVRDGIIETFAGICTEYGFSGDGGPAAEALLLRPYGVAVDPAGGVLVADTQNHVIRRIAP